MAFDDASFVLELLVASDELVKVLFVSLLGLSQLLNLIVELGKLLLGAFTLGSGHFTLHLLNLEVSIVQEFLLTSLLMLKLGNVGL